MRLFTSTHKDQSDFLYDEYGNSVMNLFPIYTDDFVVDLKH